MKRMLLVLVAALRLAAQGAVVEGRVADAVTGRPIRNAEVILRGLTRSGDPPDTDNYVAETDANGHFLVPAMVPGKYEVMASRNGYVRRIPGRPWEPGAMAQVTAGEGGHAVVALKLVPTGVISGRIVNLNGEPVAGATVEAMQEAYESNDSLAAGAVWWGLPAAARRQLQARGGATSDDRGEYRIFGLAPGRYSLRVAESRGIQSNFQAWANMPVPTFREMLYPAPLEVTPSGELRNVEIRVRPDLPHAIRGSVPSPHAPDFSIALERRGDSSGPPAFASYGTTEENFFFEGVLPGSYILSTTIHDPADRARALFARAAVEMVDRDVEGVTLQVVPMKTVTGSVSADGPLAFKFSNMNVELDPDNPDSPTLTARVAADGTFTLPVLPESYLLTRPRIAAAYFKSVKMGDRELPDLRVDFAHMNGPLRILLGTDVAKVEGVVKDAGGNPAVAARVTLIPAGAQKGWNGRLRFTNTDEDGKFALPVVAPGEYKLFAWLDAELGAPLDPEFRKKYDEQGLAVQMEAKGVKAVELHGIVTGK
ncbi:exported hypothetical protein [Candidatus Sulfopaludibacter sp. SbA3]|nr:exported hypothetical protein [Candidatus Sulfopaludibacter sp. SbA3]